MTRANWILEKTVEIDLLAHEEITVFRIEAFSKIDQKNEFRIRVFRSDLFRVHPTFGKYPLGGADHQIYVADSTFDLEIVSATSSDEAISATIISMKARGFHTVTD